VRNRKNGITSIVGSAGIDSGKTYKKPVDADLSLTGVSDEEKYQLIAEAAYYHSEKRRFEPGHELEDWLTAEAEIRTRLSSRDI
jgi:hypothetical protein